MNYIFTESEVCTGNIKLRPAISRPMIDIPVKTERSRIMFDALLYGIFPKNNNNTVYVDILCFAHPVRTRRSLTIISNTRGHYGKSRPLKNQSKRIKFLCHVIEAFSNESKVFTYWHNHANNKNAQTYIHTFIHTFSGAPRGAFQQPVYNKCKVRWLRVLARPL